MTPPEIIQMASQNNNNQLMHMMKNFYPILISPVPNVATDVYFLEKSGDKIQPEICHSIFKGIPIDTNTTINNNNNKGGPGNGGDGNQTIDI